MTSLDVWETFAQAHRARSVSGAARVLGLSQPAVTARLRGLERELGETLFERSARGLAPTRAADALALRIAPLLDQLRAALRDTSSPVRGRVNVGGASDVMSSRVVPALAPLIADGLDVDVTTGLADELLDLLAAGALDLVVSSRRPQSAGLVATAFVDEEFLLVAAPALAARLDRELMAVDPARALAVLPLAAYAPELPIIRRYWLTEFEQRPAQRVALVLPDLRGLLRAAAAGIGATVLPRYLADPALIDGTLARLHEPRLGPLNTLWIVTRPEPAVDVVSVREQLRRSAAGWSAS